MNREHFATLVILSFKPKAEDVPSVEQVRRWYDRYVETNGEEPTIAEFHRRRAAYLAEQEGSDP